MQRSVSFAVILGEMSAIAAEFTEPYLFMKHNRVVVRGPHGGSLRVAPGLTQHADGSGGDGAFAQWICEVHGKV